jgi:hypothetical protein
MPGRRLPEGTRVRLIWFGVLAGLCLLAGVVLAGLAATDPSAENPALRFLVLLAPFVVIAGLMALSAWWLTRRVRRNPDFRRRQLNGRAQATVMVGVVVAITAGNVAKAVIGVNGWAGLLVMLPAALLVLVPVMLLAKRFDPRVRWFRRPAPLTPEEEQQQEQRDTARRPDRPW